MASPEGSEVLSHEEFFLKGVAISVWQNGGDTCDSNWSRFVKKRRLFGLRGTIADGAQDCFPGFWEKYAEDVSNTKQLGSNCFRFSFEWAQIEPKRGDIDEDVIQKYHSFLNCLDEHGLVPFATLHHFTHPGWFEDIGAFEIEDNISIFVDFCKIMVSRFGQRIKFWTTFNEPTCYTFASYLAGSHAPGKTFRFISAGMVLKNILKAHIAAYKTLRESEGGHTLQVGLVHHHTKFEPGGEGYLHKPAKKLAGWCNHWWGWDVVHNFMKTGKLIWEVPLIGRVIEFEYNGKPPLDFWGINYYGRFIISKLLCPTVRNNEILTDIGYPIVPTGLYESIVKSSELGVPMYITETGAADAIGDKRRAMIKGYTNEVIRALKNGYDVRGFMYWTLVDNFEWSFGYTTRFGLYRWEPYGSQERQLRTEGEVLKEKYSKWPQRLQDMQAFASNEEVEDFALVVQRYWEHRPQTWQLWAWRLFD